MTRDVVYENWNDFLVELHLKNYNRGNDFGFRLQFSRIRYLRWLLLPRRFTRTSYSTWLAQTSHTVSSVTTGRFPLTFCEWNEQKPLVGHGWCLLNTPTRHSRSKQIGGHYFFFDFWANGRSNERSTAQTQMCRVVCECARACVWERVFVYHTVWQSVSNKKKKRNGVEKCVYSGTPLRVWNTPDCSWRLVGSSNGESFKFPFVR